MKSKNIISIDMTSPHATGRFDLICVSWDNGVRLLTFYDPIEFDSALKEAKNCLKRGELICIRTVETSEFENLYILSEEENNEI